LIQAAVDAESRKALIDNLAMQSCRPGSEGAWTSHRAAEKIEIGQHPSDRAFHSDPVRTLPSATKR
jgi:hypothetical protein